jgi:hypothetical protein
MYWSDDGRNKSYAASFGTRYSANITNNRRPIANIRRRAAAQRG